MPYVETDFKFGINLEEAVHDHLDLLELLSHVRYLDDAALIDRAIWRYEHLWLPLVAESLDISHPMIAPLDIEWVWHCHLLSPLAYERDCMEITGTVVDHGLYSLGHRDIYRRQTERLWMSKYPDEQFDVCTSGTKGVPGKFESRITYNLRDAMSRQRDFFYQVSLPHFRDTTFLAKGLERYRRFLYLRQQFPAVFLVPSYDIDLMWHTHQLHPRVYQSDTQALLGRTFSHDDSVNDRSPGSKLCLADAETRDLWKKIFEEEFMMYGTMYRGEPPAGKLGVVDKEKLKAMATKSCQVNVQNIDIISLPAEKNSKFKLDISLRKSFRVRKNTSVETLKGTGGSWGGDLCRFVFDQLEFDAVQFSLKQKVGGFCWSLMEFQGHALHDMGSVVDASYPDGGTVERVVPFDSANGVEIKYRAELTRPKLGPLLLNVTAGSYETCVIPETSDQWGPVPSGRLPADTDNTCDVASHRYLC